MTEQVAENTEDPTKLHSQLTYSYHTRAAPSKTQDNNGPAACIYEVILIKIVGT